MLSLRVRCIDQGDAL